MFRVIVLLFRERKRQKERDKLYIFNCKIQLTNVKQEK